MSLTQNFSRRNRKSLKCLCVKGSRKPFFSFFSGKRCCLYQSIILPILPLQPSVLRFVSVVPQRCPLPIDEVSPSVVREQVIFLEKGVTMNYLIRKCLYVALCLSCCISVGQLHGQVVYTITGFANNVGDGLGNAPEVAPGESYVAEFMIDLSVMDSDSSPDRGVYTGAILASSIEFSGGYSSQVDFSGGEIVIQRDNAGGGVFFNDVNGLGTILVFDLFVAFDSDALLTDPATEIVGSPASLYSLTEPTGAVVSFSDVMVGPGTGPVVLAIMALPPEIEPVVLGDLDGNRIVNFLDISPFIMRLTTGTFQAEADIDQNGQVNFLDISPFIMILVGGDDVDE